MTWEHSAPLKLNTNTLAEDLKRFGIEVALGNVPGHSDDFIIGLNRDVGGTLEDVWGAGVNMVFPTAGEQWEVLSDDVNDVFGGTGMQIALLIYLDMNYDEQVEVIIMNGTTAVVTAATDIFRPRTILGVASGSNNTNVGNVISRVEGGGATRNYVHAEFGISFDGRFTIARGFAGLQAFCQVNAGRQDGIEFRLRASIGGINNLAVLQYNNIFETVTNTILPIPIVYPETVDIVMGSLNSGAGADADCFAVCQLLTINNENLT